MPLVSISNAQRRPFRRPRWAGHGVSRAAAGAAGLSARRPSDYVAFLGRISPGEARRIAPSRSPARLASACRSRPRWTTSIEQYFEPRSSSRCSTLTGVEFLGEIYGRGEGGLARRRQRAAVPDRLAGAVRHGGDRGAGVRHARHRVEPRVGARGDRARPSPGSSSTRSKRRSRPCGCADGSRPRGSAARRSSGDSPPSAWPATTCAVYDGLLAPVRRRRELRRAER